MKKVFLLAVLGVMSLGIMAQESTDTLSDRNITIEREFTPIMQNARKIVTLPSLKTVDVGKDPVKHTYYSKTVTPDLSTSPMPSANIKFEKPDFQNGYARVGFGHNFNTIGDLGYKIDNGEASCFDINLHHLGTFGRQQYSKTNVAFTFEKGVGKTVLYGDVMAKHEWYNYYGRYYNDTLKHYYDREAMKADTSASYHNRVWNIGAHFGVHSKASSTNSYYAEVGYEMTNLKHHNMTEHRMKMIGGGEWELSVGRIGFDANARVLFYGDNSTDSTHAKPSVRGLVHLQPYYSVTGEKAWLHLGVNMDLDASTTTYFRASPNIQAEWQAMPELFSIYTNINGHYDARTYESELEHNRYADPEHLFHIEKQPYTPVDAELGFKIKPIEQLMLNVYGRYAYTMHQHYHVAELDGMGHLTGLFGDTTANEQHVAVGLSANFNWKENIRAFFDIHYNYYKAAGMVQAWDRAKLEAQIGASYRINEHWAVQLDSYFATKRYALLADGTAKELKPIYDINLGATYTLNRYVSFFLNVNNIANSKHENYYGYKVNGANCVLGACFQF